MSRLLVAMALILIVGTATPAAAHKVIAAVYAGTTAVDGEIGFSNGDPAADALVEVFDENGNTLGETRTDADGVFTYTPTQRVTHIFRADMGAGHVAEMRMAAEELPGAPVPAEAAVPVAADRTAAPVAWDQAAAPVAGDQAAAIAAAVRREIVPLRRELAAYKEKADLQSVLGGLGYIAGLFGVGFYLAARRRLRSA